MTTNNGTKAITYADGAQKIDLDEHTAAKVVESLVLRGDLSGLGPHERANHYIAVCNGLGLNPASKPLDYLRLNGKEILYPNKGATDQLAAIHKVTREIIDGPKVMDLAGTKLVYAQCRASLPGGRFETSVATVPLVDPVNVLMKVETKAKRRATLSILGLGMLDEMELETIPATAQEPGGGVDLRAARLPATPAQEPPQRPGPTLDGLGIETPTSRPQNAAETPAQSVNPVPTQEPPAWRVALDALHESAPDLAAYCNAVEALTLPGDAAPVWRSHRAAIGAMSKETKGSAWGALVARVESLGQRNAAAWITKGVKTLDAQTDAPAATEVQS